MIPRWSVSLKLETTKEPALKYFCLEFELVKGLGLESGRYGQPATLVVSKAEVYTDQEF